MSDDIPYSLVEEVVRRALAEDLGGRGDVTSQATIPATAERSFELRSRDAGILAGTAAASTAFSLVDEGLIVEWRLREGDRLEPGSVIASVQGAARSILTTERTVLNFLGRLSGIASLTRAYVDAVTGTGAKIAHTRKTTPGLRALEMAAVVAGGGARHRFGLDDAILIKDNHVAVCGGVGPAVEKARRFAGHMTRVAVEVDRLEQFDEALEAGAESVMLDNFTLDALKVAVERARGKGVVLEASGGVNLDSVRAIAETGIDVISVGSITHSARCLDLGLDA